MLSFRGPKLIYLLTLGYPVVDLN